MARNLAETPTVRLSARPRDQILSDQKVYGLWGLYSSPSRACGLLDREEPILTPTAQNFVEATYLTHLEKKGFKDGRALVDLLRKQRPSPSFWGGTGRRPPAWGGSFGPRGAPA